MTWNTTTLPDFTVHGFHTGRTVRYKTADELVREGIYQGWGVFGKGVDQRQDVIAWQPVVQLWEPMGP